MTAQIEKCTEVTRWPLTLAQGYLAGGRKREKRKTAAGGVGATHTGSGA